MSLINIAVPPNVLGADFSILASTVGENFALYPDCEVDEDTDEWHLDTTAWVLHHRPSRKIAMFFVAVKYLRPVTVDDVPFTMPEDEAVA